MKKIIAIIVLAHFVSYSACRRHADIKPGGNTGSEYITDENVFRTGGASQTYSPAFSMCAGEPKDCNLKVNIVGQADKLAALETAVGVGAGAIGTFFSNVNNWVVFPDNYPSTAQMQSLASGDYNIIIVQSSTEDNTYYFLCGPTEDLTESTPEFVVYASYQD